MTQQSSTYCCRRSRLSSSHPHPTVTPVPVDPRPSSGLYRYCMHVMHRNSCRHTNIHINSKKQLKLVLGMVMQNLTFFFFFFNKLKLSVVAHIFNLSRGRHICAFKTSLAYLVTSGTARTTRKDPVSKTTS